MVLCQLHLQRRGLAMASGKPTVAVKERGYLETMIDGSTGIPVDAEETDIINTVKTI